MNKLNPLVSIITGYYNREHLVDESLQSLIDQTYSNIEIIIFDDCSTDNTYKKLCRFKIDKRVKVIHHENNVGFTKGLINAIKESNGEFIAIHGSGDISKPDRIKRQINLILSNDKLSVVGCEDEKVLSDGRVFETSRWPAKNFYKSMINKGKRPVNGAHALIRKSYYDEVGGYREFFKYAQDSDLFSRLSLISEYDIVPEVLYSQKRQIKGSVSGDPIKRLKQIHYMVFATECAKMRKNIGYDYIDILGQEAFIALTKNKEITKKLSVHALKIYLDNKEDEFIQISEILKNQKKIIRSVFITLIRKGVISKEIGKKIYLITRKLNATVIIKTIKLNIFNVNKV